MSNWWSCTYATARWKTCLFVSMIVQDSRHRILNGTYTVRNSANGHVTNQPVSTMEELLTILQDVFHINYSGLLVNDAEGDQFKQAALRFMELDYPIKQL